MSKSHARADGGRRGRTKTNDRKARRERLVRASYSRVSLPKQESTFSKCLTSAVYSSAEPR